MNKVMYVGIDVNVLNPSWLVLDGPAASLCSASPLKHHAKGMQ